jgi:hypothetical protein
MQCKLGEDGRKEDEALDVWGGVQADMGAISDSRIFFDPAVMEYSASIAGQHGCFFFTVCYTVRSIALFNCIAQDFTANMLHLVGLGLADETDITVRGLEIVKRAERVYLEAYTSILLVDKEKLVS